LRSFAHSSLASSTTAAPSLSGVELPAVIVSPNTGSSFASFSALESGRRFWSRSSPAYGVTRSSKKPRSYAAASRWWLAAASSSCASREIFHSFAVIAACSPMLRPVRGSALRGMSGTMWLGRRRPTSLTRAPVLFARRASIITLRRSSLRPTGASEAVSAPPAMPASTCPSAILLATRTAASRPVSHACWTS
jgi:hypothetical protein